MTSLTSTTSPTDSRVSDFASACLAVRRFGIVATRVIADAVGPDYTDNSVIACLGALADESPLRLRDLTEVIALPGPNLSRTIDRLQAHGDVTRRPGDPKGDGRAVLIAITPAGRRHAAAIAAAFLSDRDAVRGDVAEAMVRLRRMSRNETTEPDQVADPAGMCTSLARLGIAMGGALKSISKSGDITEALALMTLVDVADSRPTAIAERVGLSSGGTTKLLDRLELAGHIERSFGIPGDRRAVRVRLTNSGRDQLVRMTDEIEPYLPELTAVFTAVVRELA